MVQRSCTSGRCSLWQRLQYCMPQILFLCKPALSVLTTAQVFLVFGKSGWIGGLVGQLLKEQGIKYEYATARLEDRAGILADIERVRQNLFLFGATQLVQLRQKQAELKHRSSLRTSSTQQASQAGQMWTGARIIRCASIRLHS